MKININANSSILSLDYKLLDGSSAEYTNCFKMHHFDRYLPHNYFYTGIQTVSPDERNTDIYLIDTKMKLDRIEIDFGHEGEYDKRIYDTIHSRIDTLDRVKTLPQEDLTGLIALQELMAKKTGQLNKYILDFHRGAQTLQE